MEDAVGYVRVSTEEQSRGGISLDAQEQSIQAYAAMRGFHLIRTFREEGVSGGIPLARRKQGKLLANMMAKRQGPRHVIAVKLDRLFRSASDALNQSSEWEKMKRALHFTDVGGNALDTSSAMGKMYYTMSAAFAEMERNIGGERTRATLGHLRDTGRVYCRITPLGFDRRDNDLVVNRAEMSIVRKMRRLRGQGLSFDGIAKRLNRTHVPTKTGALWHAVTIWKVVNNELYQKRTAQHGRQ